MSCEWIPYESIIDIDSRIKFLFLSLSYPLIGEGPYMVLEVVTLGPLDLHCSGISIHSKLVNHIYIGIRK